MHFSGKGSEALPPGLGTSACWGQSQWCHRGESRRLRAELGWSGLWPGLVKWVAAQHRHNNCHQL